MTLNGQNDKETTDELREKSGATHNGATDDSADTLTQPGSSATGAGTSMGSMHNLDTTGGTTDADVTDGGDQ